MLLPKEHEWFMESRRLIKVEVVYGVPERQKIVVAEVPEHSTVAEAVRLSEISQFFPEIDLDKNAVGIWNRTAKPTALVVDGDRIEIYRPLIADPKEARRQRAEKAKADGRANKITGGRI